MTDHNKFQPWYIKTIFSIVIFILLFGLTEIFLRVIEPDLFYKNQRFPVNRDIDFPEVYKKDAELFWRFRPNQTIDSKTFSNVVYKINDQGMRGKEISPEKQGFRIIALGNSCTFGWGVQNQHIWTTLVEDSLNQLYPDKKIELINCGVPGYSSFQGKKYFINELQSLQPDLLLIMFGWNDQWPAGGNIYDKDQQTPNAVVLQLQNIFSRLKIYQLFRKMLLSLTEDKQMITITQQSGNRRVTREDFQKNLREIIKTAKSNKTKSLLMVPPIASLTNYKLGTVSPFHKLHESYQKKIVSSAGYEQIEYVNHQPIFDEYNDLFTNPADDPIHFNEKGHSVFANQILKKIIPIIKN